MYAGQKKVSRDIDKAVKREKSKGKSNEKKSAYKKALYYGKLLKNQIQHFYEDDEAEEMSNPKLRLALN